MTRSSKKSPVPPEDRPPALEWGVAALGFLIVAGVIGFLVWRIANREESPPRIRIETGAVEKVESDYLVPFVLRNEGGGNALGVIVEGRLEKDGETVETSTVTIDAVPAGSRSEGGLFFTTSPSDATLRVRALGYTRP